MVNINEVPDYLYRADVINVVDGDTFDVKIDLGFETFVTERVRTRNIDTRETHFVEYNSEEYQRGKMHTGAFIEWVEATRERGKSDTPFVFYSKKYKRGTYGRVVGDLYSPVLDNWCSEYLLKKFDDVTEYK